MLVVSPFDGPARRATTVIAEQRNRFVSALAQELLVLHANPGGRVECLCREAAAADALVWTLDLPENAAAIEAGARPTSLDQFARHWRSRVFAPSPATILENGEPKGEPEGDPTLKGGCP